VTYELVPVLARLKEIEAWKAAIRSDLFYEQCMLLDDPALMRAVHSGRRAGKSEGMPRYALLEALDAGPGQTVIIGAETLKKCKALHWDKIREVVIKHKLPFVPNGQEHTWITPWKSKIVLWGLLDDGAVQLLRGFAIKAAFFDECATYSSKLTKLVDEVLEPALGDYAGKLSLFGTPTATRVGPWFDICCGKDKHRFSVHHWDARKNPFFRKETGGAMAWFQGILAKNGWTWDSATFAREYLGLFVDDSDQLVYRYSQSDLNNVLAMPKNWDRDLWGCTVGVDFGINDDCAWTAIGSHPHERKTYALESFKKTGMLTDEAAQTTVEVCERYRPMTLVGDTGGLGKPYAEEWNRRHAGKATTNGYTLPPMIAADKLGKRAHIDLVNTEFRTGRLVLVKPKCEALAGELTVLPWYKGERLKEHPAYPNHCADSLLYATTQHFSYLNSLPVKRAVKIVPTPDEDSAIEAEEERYRSRRNHDWRDD
jgi:hypothetical protein